jgi:hypothetical protein
VGAERSSGQTASTSAPHRLRTFKLTHLRGMALRRPILLQVQDGQQGCLEDEMMELEVPTAIRAQLLTLPDDERIATLSRLHLLAQDPDHLGADVKKSPHDAQLWTVRLSARMRALVRADGNCLHVLAVAPRDQLLPYLAPNGQQAA